MKLAVGLVIINFFFYYLSGVNFENENEHSNIKFNKKLIEL